MNVYINFDIARYTDFLRISI